MSPQVQEPPGEQPRHGVVSVLTSDVGTDAALDVSVQESELGVSAADAPVASNNQYTNSPLQAGADSYPLMRSLGLRDPGLTGENLCASLEEYGRQWWIGVHVQQLKQQ